MELYGLVILGLVAMHPMDQSSKEFRSSVKPIGVYSRVECEKIAQGMQNGLPKGQTATCGIIGKE